MTVAPLLPVMPSGALPPSALLLRWLEALQRDGVGAVVAGGLPPLNGSLPDLLALGGIDSLLCGGFPREAFRWEGHGGGRVTVSEAGATEDGLDLHHGDLPAGPAPGGADLGLRPILELARLEDASACLGLGSGADWSALLPLLDRERAPVLPSALFSSSHLGGSAGSTGAWNPLPFAREVVIHLPDTLRPWGFRDAVGREVPAQVVQEGGTTEVLVSLPLGALEATTLTALADPPPDAEWEVTAQVLDNGVLRAEFDELGQVVRLCWNGVFAEPAGPLALPELDGIPLGGSVTIEVVETGPVRARLVVRRTAAEGVLDLSYTLHVHEDCLRIKATWSGPDGLALAHPTCHRAIPAILAGELASCDQAQADSIIRPPMPPTTGVRWAALPDPGGRGLAVAAPWPISLRIHGGNLRVHLTPTTTDGTDKPVTSTTTFALTSAQRSETTLDLGQLACHLAVPGRPFIGDSAVPAPFRLTGDPLLALWIRRPDGWAGELLLVNQRRSRGRTWLFPRTPLTEGWRVDASGHGRMPVRLTRERDGLELDHGPGEVLLVRWR